MATKFGGMVKNILILAGVIIGALIIYGTQDIFGISDETFSTALLFVVIVGSVWYFSNRLDRLEERVLHTDYSRIKAAIEDGPRHKPQHQQPRSLVDGGAVKSFITPAHESLFEDFRWFGAVLNQQIATPWAIEELNDTDFRSMEGPEVGRRYQVYYNACEMGTIQVTVGGLDGILRPETFAENRQAYVEVELNYLRFVPYNDAHDLIRMVALLIGQFGDDGEDSRSKAAAVANAALTGYLWESIRNPDIDMAFDFRTEGPYDLLASTVDHWKSNGIDPFEKWGGDRSWSTDENTVAMN